MTTAPIAKPGITFVIPIRHPKNCRDWGLLKKNFTQTIASIAAQESPNWNAVVGASRGADLPPLPDKFEVAWVDFPPNPHYELKGDRQAYNDAVRLDKGRRMLAAMLHGTPREYFMLVDDDDFIARDLAGFAANHRGQSGWCFREGYIWPNRGKKVYLYPDFSNFCGTSHIVRADLYQLPARFEDATDTYIRQMLGSHVFIDEFLKSNGTPLAPLPFPGAVYRVDHSGAHSKSKGLLRSFFFTGKNLRNPLLLLDAFTRLRTITPEIRARFGLPETD